MAAGAAHAQCQPMTVTNGDDDITCTGVDNDGVRTFGGTDTVTVEDGAQVFNTGTAGEDAINLGAGVGDTAVNNGSISTTGNMASGIFDPFFAGSNSNGVITNNGTIETTGIRSSAVRADGDGSVITNSASGTIRTGGTGAEALEGNGDSITATNAGNIVTTGDDGDAIDVLADPPDGGNTNIVNSGSITTSGDDADGITANGRDSVIRNEGNIVTQGGVGTLDTVVGPESFAGADGIVSDGANASITNTGSITTNGPLSDGIIVRGANVSILNALGASINVDGSLGSTCIFAVNAPGVAVTNNGALNCDGAAVRTGIGADSVVLGPDSTTDGNFLLGDGNDSVAINGSAMVDGSIDGGPDTDSLVLDGGAGEAGVVNGDITRFESLDKNGAGAFTLNGDAQVGQANVNAGTLNLVGSTLDGNAAVDNGAELDVQNTTVTGDLENSGLLDSNAGPLQVNGDFVQMPNGELQVLVGNPGAPGTDVSAGGDATLDGTATVDFVGAPQDLPFGNSTLPVVTAAGTRNGEFANENISGNIQGNQFDSLFTSMLIYDDDQALLQINRSSQFGATLAGDLNRVQTATAGAFDDASAGNDLSPELAQIISDVNNLGADGQLQALQTAGLGTHEDLADVSRFATRQVQSTLNLRQRGLCAQDAERDEHCLQEGLWLEVFGQQPNQDRDGEGFLGYDADTYGAALGNDWAAGPGYLGFSAGLSESDVDFNRNGGNADIGSYFFAGYGGVNGVAWYANANIVFARHEYEQQRNVVIGADSSVAQSEHDGEEYAANAEVGYDWIQRQNWALTPFAALEYSLLDEEGFNEDGAGALNQRVESRETDALRSDLGLRLTSQRHVGSGNVLSGWASAAWSHDYDIDDRQVRAVFAGAPNTRFSVDGRDIDENGAKAELGVAYGNPKSWRMSLRTQGEIRDRFDRIGAQLRLTKLFE